jgi:hypothetical protein
MRRRLLSLTAVGLLCVTTGAATALGDGGPGPGVVQGWEGVARGKIRYVAISTGTDTVLEAIRRRTGRVGRWAIIPGNFGIPQVAFDGTTDGLSADGRTLVLGDGAVSRQLRKTSSFAVVDTRRFVLRRIVRLKGDFSYDALSRDARMLYLVEHVTAQDYNRYRVRAYDLGAQRLLQKVVIDKRSWASVMQGVPLTRVSTPDGAWVYTLYGGATHPFVHALNTSHVNAVCIDLPRSWQRLDIGAMRLRLNGEGNIVVRHRAGGKPLAVLDTASFRVLSAVRNP